MNNLAVSFNEFVDPETGEILDLKEELVIKDIPLIGRHLAAIESRINTIDSYERDELERIQVICEIKRDKLQEQHSRALSRAEVLMKETGETRLDYPGLGVFRFGQSRESVNDTAYGEMSEEGRTELHMQFPKLFRRKTTVLPNKKEIMATAQAGVLPTPGFLINPKHETFTFKAEA